MCLIFTNTDSDYIKLPDTTSKFCILAMLFIQNLYVCDSSPCKILHGRLQWFIIYYHYT